MASQAEIEVARPSAGNEPGTRTALGLNCAARIGSKLHRECVRKAAKGDYCKRHWTANFGHEFKFNTDLRMYCANCGVSFRGQDDDICSAKVDFDDFPAAGHWNPIETAPVGQSVLIYIPNADHYGEGIYRALLIESDFITNKDGSHPRHWQTTGLHIGRDCLSQLPTHWMPLPDPPEVKQ